MDDPSLAGRGERGLGHTTIQQKGPKCVCDRTGCVEAVHHSLQAKGRRREAADVLGTAVMNLVQLLDVSHVVLSGRYVLDDQDEYVHGVRGHLPRSSWLPVDVSVSGLGEDVVALGAARLVLGQLFS